MVKDRSSKLKTKKQVDNRAELEHEETEANEANEDSGAMASANAKGTDMGESADLKAILEEIRDFRRENAQQFEEIKAEMCNANVRLDEAEVRILETEERVQTMEDAMTELLQLHAKLEHQITDQEGRSRRNNVRIYGVVENGERNMPSMSDFVEKLLRENLQLPPTLNLHIERAHRALTTAAPSGAPPRSIIVRFLDFKTKEEVLKKAWQMKGFQWEGKQVNLDHDYAPEVLKQRKTYIEAKKVLKQRGIRFQTPFPAKLRVFYTDGTILYNTAEDATRDMVERGLPVTVYKQPESLVTRIKKWTTVGKQREKRQPEDPEQAGRSTFKKKLQQYRRDSM